MAESQPQQASLSQRFMRGAGDVHDPNHELWAPVRWVVQFFQYLVAMIIITIGEGMKAIFKGESPEKKREHELRRQQRGEGHKKQS